MSNLLNPMNSESILKNKGEMDKQMSVQQISRIFYDRLLIKDPMTLYMIIETGEIYKGDIPISPTMRLNPGKRYLSIRESPAGFEYVISEERPKGMLEICSYNNPQDALDFLTSSYSKSDPKESIKNIVGILKRYRDNQGSILSETVVSIMEVVFRAENNESPVVGLFHLFLGNNALVNPHNPELRDPRFDVIKRRFSYRIYAFIWDWIADNYVYDKYFSTQSEEDEWLNTISNDLYTQLISRFSAR